MYRSDQILTDSAIGLKLFKLDPANPTQLTKLDSIEALLHH